MQRLNDVPTMPTPDPIEADLTAVRQLLRWLTPLVVGFAAVHLTASFVLRDLTTALVGGCLVGYAVCVLWARRLATQGKLLHAVAVLAGGLVVPDLAILVLEPRLAQTLGFVPLVAVGMVLPFASQRSIWRLLAGTWVWTIVVVLLGELLSARGGTFGYTMVFRVASSGATVGIILLLLAQFRHRLTIAFDRERAAVERFRELDAMKTTFLHAVSHDLRSPLTSIMGSAGTLARYDLPPDQQQALLGGILRGADKLRRLLDDLLDLDRFDEGRLTLDFEMIDVSELVRSAVATADLPEEREITIDAEPVEVAVDGPKVERIVENLLINACRHTGPDSPIWVRVRRREGGVLLMVEDAGLGVPPELRASIFEPFRRGPETDQTSGTGIGLSLVSRFAELHHGRAWVQERAGGGASFRVFLPDAQGRDMQPEGEAISG